MGRPVEEHEKYTYEDYRNWPDHVKCEIIDGEIYDMSPAPRVKHQNIASNLLVALKTHPENPCYTGIAPTDVVLDERNVVQPDVFLVCDRNKIAELNVRGAPDLIVEIASPSTERKDRREKKELYERFGVREYIIVFPEAEYAERYILNKGAYRPSEIYNWDESFSLSVIDAKIDLRVLFDRENPRKSNDGPNSIRP